MPRQFRAVAVALILAASLPHLSCTPASDKWRLPGVETRALKTVKTSKVVATPSVPPYHIDPEFSNVERRAELAALPKEHQRLLAQNAFLVSTCPKLDMYELYCDNPSPFITTDCVFHAYHVLLADTLSNLEEAVLAARLESLVAAAHKAALGLRASVPPTLEVPAERALAYWAVAHRLMDPNAVLAPGIRDEVVAEVARIVDASFIGKLAGEKRMRDYTVYRPIAGYGRSEKMKRYFRCNRFLSLTPVAFQTGEQAQTCALTAMALWSEKEAWRTYQDLSDLSCLLSGNPEDVSPRDVLAILRARFGDAVSPEGLAEKATADELQAKLTGLKPPIIADQPQDRPGADALAGWGMRILPPGVTIRAKAFQRLGEMAILPSGEHILYLLGNKAVPLHESQEKALSAAREMLSRDAVNYDLGLDVHTSSLVALSKLSGDRSKGYPGFMGTRAWAIKTANAQLGAWSQIEHDVFLYAKDTNQYLCDDGEADHFGGYVEPEPEYYAALAALVARTRAVFEDFNAFESIRALAAPGRGAAGYQHHATVATAKHYKTLEEILLKLKTMSEKELGNRTFDESESALLKEFGEKLKWLAFNESNSSEAREPMSGIVRIAREYLSREGLYVGTGRPLQILVIVPWQGKLHWCTGAAYSYYQFMNPLAEPITDADWKRQTLSTFAAQERRPWLFQHDVGLAQRTLSHEALANWLSNPHHDFGRTDSLISRWPSYITPESAAPRLLIEPYDGPPDTLGFVKLDAQAIDFAANAFARGQCAAERRYDLYGFLDAAPKDVRRKAALEALSTATSEINKGADACPIDYSLWIYLSLRLLKDAADDEAAREAILALKQQGKADVVFDQCRKDPDVCALLEKAGIRAEQRQKQK